MWGGKMKANKKFLRIDEKLDKKIGGICRLCHLGFKKGEKICSFFTYDIKGKKSSFKFHPICLVEWAGQKIGYKKIYDMLLKKIEDKI